MRVNASVYVCVSHTHSVTHTHVPTYMNTDVHISGMTYVFLLDLGKAF